VLYQLSYTRFSAVMPKAITAVYNCMERYPPMADTFIHYFKSCLI